jgi:outer membrane protein TolC
VLALTILATPAETQVAANPAPGDREIPGPGEAKVIGLGTCIETALVNNLNIKAEEIRTRTSALEIMASRGIFDPVLFSDLNRVDFESPTVNLLETGEQVGGVVSGDQTLFDVGIRQRLFTGLTAELRYDQRRDKSNRAFLALNPSYTTNLGLSVTQPLLRGGWSDVNLAEIRIAQTNLDITSAQYHQSIDEIVLQVIEAYWQLSFAEQSLRVAQESLDLAINERQITESKVKSGLWAQLELDQAQTEEYSRLAERVEAQKALEDAKDNLRKLLYPMERLGDWSIDLKPRDELRFVEFEKQEEWLRDRRSKLPEWNESAGIALQNRPEMIQARLDLENRETDIAVARNQVLPALDLSGSYTWNVLGEDYRENFEDLFIADERTWTAGLSFELPIGNRAARADLAQAKLELRRARIQLKEQENTVVAEVREAIRGMEAALQRIEYSHKALISARKQLSAAQSRRDRGFLTNFEVLQFQRDLSVTDQTLNDAWRQYRVARARLEKARGTLTVVEESGIRVPPLEEARREAREGE